MITLTRAELQAALDAIDEYYATTPEGKALIETLRARLAQQEEKPEPVAWLSRSVTNGPCLHWNYRQAHKFSDDISPLYLAPPQRSSSATPSEWQQLTDEEIKDFYGDDDNFSMTKKYVIAFARAIEAKLKEKNGY